MAKEIIQALILGFLLIVAAPFPVSAGNKEDNIAKHYVIFYNAALETVLSAAKNAANLSANEPWLPETNSCLTPPSRSECRIPSEAILPRAPVFWQIPKYPDGSERWHILLRNGLCYIYGIADEATMAAIRKTMRHTATLAFCMPHAKDGAACLPKLLAEDGTPLPLPNDLSTAEKSVISIFAIK